MMIKVCGLNGPVNTKELSSLAIDFAGFIFYPASPRYCKMPVSVVKSLPAGIRKTGVFVNAARHRILTLAEVFNLQYVQLHGQESPEFCEALRKDVKVIKAFPMKDQSSFSGIETYAESCDYFLFDTATEGYGGSGQAFDWRLLQEVPISKPFFLSGGIGLDNIEAVLQLRLPNLAGIDVNSKFETQPGIKDISKIKQLISMIKPSL